MKKNILITILTLVFCLFMAVPGLAESENAEYGFADEYYRLMDMASLLSDADVDSLTAKLDELSLRQKMDVVIATTNTLEGKSVVEYADDLYDYCSFGYGANRDGLLLVISMEDNDWYISTCGYGITAFTDAGIEYIGEQIVPYLSDKDFAGAFAAYITLCDEFITQARTGKPYDIGSLPRKPLSPVWILVCLIIGLMLSFVTVGKMKAKLTTVRAQAAANSYMKNGSMNITDSREMFLYKNVTRTKRSSESSGGGSSTHTSSSGTSHGGGGGKF